MLDFCFIWDYTYPRIEDDTLVSISVRFYMPDGHENAEVEKKIYRAITEISNGRLFPEKNGLLWNGIPIKSHKLPINCKRKRIILLWRNLADTS